MGGWLDDRIFLKGGDKVRLFCIAMEFKFGLVLSEENNAIAEQPTRLDEIPFT